MERISPHRLAHIDSIRAIAALMVVAIHSSAAVVPVRPVAMHAGQVFDWLVQNLDFGRIGVVLFFVISGFVIPASLREGTRRGEFWVRRALRLYPAYWVSIALAALVHWQIAGSAWSPRVLLANATMLQSFLHVGDLEGVYWTLKLELAFYAGCYLLHRLGLLRRDWVPGAVALGWLLVFLFYLDYWNGPFPFQLGGLAREATAHAGGGGVAHHAIPGLLNMNWGNFAAYFAAMFTGAGLRRWHDGTMSRTGSGLLALVLALWLGLLPVLWLLRNAQGPDPGLISIFLAMPFAVALFLLLAFVFKLRGRVLPLIGAISYSLYLLHPLVLDEIAHLANLAGWSVLGRSTPLLLALCVLLSLPLSALLFWAVERPAMQWGRRWSRG